MTSAPPRILPMKLYYAPGACSLAPHIVMREMSTQPFLLGNSFSAGDACLFAVLGLCRPLGLRRADWPALARHAQAVAARPAVQAAMRAEGLID